MPCVAVSSSSRSSRSRSSSRRACSASSARRRSVTSSSSPVSRVTLAVGVAVGASQALHPRHRPVGPHEAKRVVPRILRCRRQDLLEQPEHLRAILLVHARQPRLERRRLVGREAV